VAKGEVSDMNLYLVQHGEAKSEEEDPSRPLSEKGAADVRKVASFLFSGIGIRIESIFQSGKLRAAQTAGILGEYLRPPRGTSQRDGLAPMDDPAVWAKRLEIETADIMLVGHLPHLARLAALLLCGMPDRKVVNFHMGGMVCLKKTEDTWSMDWMIMPEMMRA
jgi:phosphohistidine phosphatase